MVSGPVVSGPAVSGPVSPGETVTTRLVSLDDVRSAVRCLDGVVVRTPLVPLGGSSPGPLAGALSPGPLAGAPSPGSPGVPDGIWIKPENLQPVGSFKIRGATYALSRLPPRLRTRGVITHSSGNHGQALAYAGRAAGVSVTVVMPDTAPEVKIEATRRYGAEIVLVPPAERYSRTESLIAERGLTLVPPFDHRDVIAGQGTVGIEIVEDLPDVAAVVVPLGGGGLASGVATAVKALAPRAAVIGAEPVYAADAEESLRAGELRTWPVERTYRTVADGLRTGLSELTFEHLRQRLDAVVTVTDVEILSTVRTLAYGVRIVAEPSGAVAPAAVLHRRAELPTGPVVAVVSGGNVDPSLLVRLLA